MSCISASAPLDLVIGMCPRGWSGLANLSLIVQELGYHAQDALALSTLTTLVQVLELDSLDIYTTLGKPPEEPSRLGKPGAASACPSKAQEGSA